jgi:arginase family enzyme
LLEKGLKHYAVLGARDFQNSPAYLQRVRDTGGTIVTAAEIHAQGVRKAVRKALDALPKDGALYLSVDMDVADSSVAPAVSAPTPGGLLSHQLLELVRAITSDPRLVACDIMELAPPLEVQGFDLTARLAAACLAEMISTARS